MNQIFGPGLQLDGESATGCPKADRRRSFVRKTIEHGPFIVYLPKIKSYMVMFHSYIKAPEGKNEIEWYMMVSPWRHRLSVHQTCWHFKIKCSCYEEIVQIGKHLPLMINDKCYENTHGYVVRLQRG